MSSKDIFFCKNYLINSIISSIFGWLFLDFKKLVNKGQILNFYKHFIKTWDSQDEFVI